MITNTKNIKHKKVLITGQGRGGTTAVASIFNRLGYYMPSAHRLATFEDHDLRSLFASGDIDSVVKKLSARASQNELVAWKDPKLFSLNGLRLAEALSEDWLYVIVFRDPFSIAMRNNISMGSELQSSLCDAARLNVKLVDFYMSIQNRHPCYLISYEKLMTSMDVTINSLLKYLGMDNVCDMVPIIKEKMLMDKQRYLEAANVK